MSIIEQLRITPIKAVELWVKKGRWCPESKVRKVEQQRDDLLQEIIAIIENPLRANFENPKFTIHKVTGKTWGEIEEMKS